MVDFGKYSIIPESYSLRSQVLADAQHLRNWNLETSPDGSVWVVLREHKDDTSLNCFDAKCTWRLDRHPLGAMRFFRFRFLFKTSLEILCLFFKTQNIISFSIFIGFHQRVITPTDRLG